ncbi:MAG: ribonuclease HI family protein [Candidatus Jorgensenbacteria bacterium]|nr:ribonuclease HI family protein [Candidatus Jorgensenbacteria bacterium]
MEENNKLTIYTDGGARGNPGPAGIGVVINENPAMGFKAKHYSETIGRTTNNVAEYKAVIFALKKAKLLLGGDKANEVEIEIKSDSEFVVRQLNGTYKLKDEELKPFFIEIWNLKQDFKNVSFSHVPREHNTTADSLVNRALDTLL